MDIVCFSSADWDAPLWTNKQHLMSRLARAGVRVLYVDSLGLRRPQLGGRDGRRMLRRVATWRPVARQISRNLLRDSPLVLPGARSSGVLGVNRILLRARTRRNLWFHRLERPILWTYVPTAVDVFDPTRFSAVVYHCVDDLAAYPGIDARAFRDAETALLRHADVAIASSRPLERHLSRSGAKELLYWPNPADTEALVGCALNGAPRDRPVAGFVGALAEHKVDAELVREVARLLPEWRFELVGPTGLGLPRSTFSSERFPRNVSIGTPVKPAELRTTLARFTVGIIPYARNAYTASVFPLKVFEYLASGLPVVSTSLPSLVGEVDHVAFADSPAEFANALRRASETTPDERRLRVKYARAFSWTRRTEDTLGLLGRLAAA
jgi:glycosyltransferase involved in cell wall biosynthesis